MLWTAAFGNGPSVLISLYTSVTQSDCCSLGSLTRSKSARDDLRVASCLSVCCLVSVLAGKVPKRCGFGKYATRKTALKM